MADEAAGGVGDVDHVRPSVLKYYANFVVLRMVPSFKGLMTPKRTLTRDTIGIRFCLVRPPGQQAFDNARRDRP
jgi:hypothetical protein